MATVNLLDLRDEEENKGSAGGRWAGRNPKAKAKQGGRQRRQRHRDDGGNKESGFGRKTSNVSQMSDASEVSDVGEEAEAPPAAAAAAPEPVQQQASAPKEMAPKGSGQQNALLARLSNKGQDQTTELLKATIAEPSTADIELGDVGTKSEDGENVWEEAKKIARQREVLKDEDSGVEGKEFKRKYWEYYMVKSTWSDGLCVALNHASMVPFCAVPCLWPYRLLLTIRRAAPIKIKMCCINCPLGGCCGCPIVTIIFSLPLLAVLTFVPAVSQLMQDQFVNIPILKDRPDKAQTAQYVSIALVSITAFLMVFWWARIILGIGTKYSIKAAVNKPNSFVFQAMCCICAMNQRAAVHVDRAQGFMAPLKTDKTAVELSDQTRLVNPQQHAMV